MTFTLNHALHKLCSDFLATQNTIPFDWPLHSPQWSLIKHLLGTWTVPCFSTGWDLTVLLCWLGPYRAGWDLTVLLCWLRRYCAGWDLTVLLCWLGPYCVSVLAGTLLFFSAGWDLTVLAGTLLCFSAGWDLTVLLCWLVPYCSSLLAGTLLFFSSGWDITVFLCWLVPYCASLLAGTLPCFSAGWDLTVLLCWLTYFHERVDHLVIREDANKTEDITPQIYQDRQASLYKNCENVPKVKRIGSGEPKYFFDRTNSIAFCKAPKSGSTFVGTIVAALMRNAELGNMFHVNREYVHSKNAVKFSNILDKELNSVKTVLVTRNPYSRLFSAFIDKYFILAQWGSNLAQRKRKGLLKMRNGYCGYNVTFDELLDSISMGEIIERHTIPVSTLCMPCTLHYDIVCRQETLTTDIEHVLNIINITESKRSAIIDMIHGRSLNDTIYSWISSQLSYFAYSKKDCSDIVLYMEKLWWALQFQGYISLSWSFPADEFKKLNELKAESLTSLIVKLINSAPLSKSEMKTQRLRVLREAYSRVQPSTIAKLQAAFAQDFHLFGYDTSVPL
ncbi:uncharacterized protein LOC132559261 [Ylistrum balloti]|uniref:uncharacterized protein LOC132559261 n=1 Tax=Ylistrum balloti TaxID=509963 RepID=UPI002905E05B|nr:uncharacterized protein LOC132559261 [Ylistrum balloti]